jgi:hypothetical protein
MLGHIDELAARGAGPYPLSVLSASYATLCVFFPEDAGRAAEYARRGIALAEQCDHPSARAIAMCAVGQAVEATPVEAATAHEASIALIDAGAADTVYAHAHRGVARAAIALGDWPRAAAHLRAAFAHCERVGDHPTIQHELDEAGVLLLRSGDAAAGLVLLGHTDANPAPRFVPPQFAEHLEELARQARAELGDDASEGARRRGAAMDEREVVAFALDQLRSLEDNPTP